MLACQLSWLCHTTCVVRWCCSQLYRNLDVLSTSRSWRLRRQIFFLFKFTLRKNRPFLAEVREGGSPADGCSEKIAVDKIIGLRQRRSRFRVNHSSASRSLGEQPSHPCSVTALLSTAVTRSCTVSHSQTVCCHSVTVTHSAQNFTQKNTPSPDTAHHS